MIGAPPALGLALAFARRVNQIVFAVLGFIVLAADRVASRVHGESCAPAAPAQPGRPDMTSSTKQHARVERDRYADRVRRRVLCGVLLWLVTGPMFHYSDTWQLVINTGTTS